MTSSDMQQVSEIQLSDTESEPEMSDFLTDLESETTDEGDLSDDSESDVTENDEFDDGVHFNTLTDEDLENFRYSRSFDSQGQASARERRLMRRNQLTNSNVENAPRDDSPVNSIQNTTE